MIWVQVNITFSGEKKGRCLHMGMTADLCISVTCPERLPSISWEMCLQEVEDPAKRKNLQ